MRQDGAYIRILLVEDNPGDARLLEAMLLSAVREPASIQQSQTIEDALSKAMEQAFDVAFLDLSLPDASGLEGLSQLVEAAPYLPVIILTGLDSEQLSLDALRLGAQDYLLKNHANSDALGRIIEYAIERQGLSNVLRQRVDELNAARLRFRSLIEDNADAILVIDANGYVGFANRAAEELLARPVSELVNEHIGIPFDGNNNAEVDLVRRDGRQITADMRVMKTFWEGEEAYIATFRDVTEQRRTERALRIAKRAAEASNRMKSAFLANMSHELRTPLNGILGFSDVMLHKVFGPIDNAKYEDYIHSIHRSGKHLLGLINDLLDHSKIEAGEFSIAGGTTDPQELIALVIESIQTSADAKNIGITANTDAIAALEIRADDTRLRQVLLNLLSNAIKFTPSGGRITVDCTRDHRGNVTIAVIDNGIGIPPEQIPKALAPFGQLEDPYTKRQAEGTGLGLPLSKRLIELHGGSLRISQTPGGGTTVTVVLPAYRVVQIGDGATVGSDRQDVSGSC